MTTRPVQLVGLLLWRGGMLVAGAAVLFEVMRRVLTFITIPVELEVGFGLILAGFVMVIMSLIMERVRDAQLEGDLQE